jgi:hypothetical protein
MGENVNLDVDYRNPIAGEQSPHTSMAVQFPGPISFPFDWTEAMATAFFPAIYRGRRWRRVKRWRGKSCATVQRMFHCDAKLR